MAIYTCTAAATKRRSRGGWAADGERRCDRTAKIKDANYTKQRHQLQRTKPRSLPTRLKTHKVDSGWWNIRRAETSLLIDGVYPYFISSRSRDTRQRQTERRSVEDINEGEGRGQIQYGGSGRVGSVHCTANYRSLNAGEENVGTVVRGICICTEDSEKTEEG
jgi:hypothetical protein